MCPLFWLYVCMYLLIFLRLLLYLAYLADLMASCVEIVSCCDQVS